VVMGRARLIELNRIDVFCICLSWLCFFVFLFYFLFVVCARRREEFFFFFCPIGEVNLL
jgi:hypothetical protein